MSPELERLLEALHEKLTCPPPEKRQRETEFEQLLENALARQPGINREQILDAIRERYAAFRRARHKPTTLPPQA